MAAPDPRLRVPPPRVPPPRVPPPRVPPLHELLCAAQDLGLAAATICRATGGRLGDRVAAFWDLAAAAEEARVQQSSAGAEILGISRVLPPVVSLLALCSEQREQDVGGRNADRRNLGTMSRSAGQKRNIALGLLQHEARALRVVAGLTQELKDRVEQFDRWKASPSPLRPSGGEGPGIDGRTGPAPSSQAPPPGILNFPFGESEETDGAIEEDLARHFRDKIAAPFGGVEFAFSPLGLAMELSMGPDDYDDNEVLRDPMLKDGVMLVVNRPPVPLSSPSPPASVRIRAVDDEERALESTRIQVMDHEESPRAEHLGTKESPPAERLETEESPLAERLGGERLPTAELMLDTFLPAESTPGEPLSAGRPGSRELPAVVPTVLPPVVPPAEPAQSDDVADAVILDISPACQEAPVPPPLADDPEVSELLESLIADN